MAGYYEWARKGQVYYVHPAGNAPALLACGLWSEVAPRDYTGPTMTILIEAASGERAAIHDRQPVIADAENATAWLEGVSVEQIERLAGSGLAMHRVDSRIGNWREEGPELIEPVADEP